jgi:hypothetical protein
LNRGDAGADRRQRTLGLSDGTAAQGFGESWEVQWRLRESAKELPWLRRVGRPRRAGHPCNGCRASRGFVAARPNRGSGGLLEGSRRGAEPACGSGQMRRGVEGPDAGERPGRSGR